MYDLFSFGDQSRKVDRYSGMGQYDKYKKMITRANVGMLLDDFTPFKTAKRLVHPTNTMLSLDGTDIDGVDGAIVPTMSDNKKNKRIIVNTETLTGVIEDHVKPDMEFEYFENQLKMAYTSFSNQTRATGFMSMYVKDNANGVITDDYMNAIELAHSLAKFITIGCGNDKNMLIEQPVFDSTSSRLVIELQKLYKRETGDLTDLVLSSNRSAGAFGAIENMIESIVAEDLISLEANNIDAIGNTLAAMVDIPRLTAYVKGGMRDPDKDTDAKEACSVGSGKVDYDESPKFSEAPTAKDKAWTVHNDSMEADGHSATDDNSFFNQRGYEDDYDFTKDDHLVEALYESLKGRLGKFSSQNPAKRLNKRNVAAEISDNIYLSRNPIGGKELHINVVIDTSGSMSGNYIEDAVHILYIFNELARRGVVRGNIMLSANGASGMWEFPMNLELLKSIRAHNGGEGFRHTMAIRWKELKRADFNIAITDGHLTDGYIDLAEFDSAGIEVTGMYIDRGISNKELTRHTNGLKQWFHNSIVRNSIESGVYAIVDSSLLQLNRGDKHV